MAALSPTLAGVTLFQKYREALNAVGGTPEVFLTSDFEAQQRYFAWCRGQAQAQPLRCRTSSTLSRASR